VSAPAWNDRPPAEPVPSTAPGVVLGARRRARVGRLGLVRIPALLLLVLAAAVLGAIWVATPSGDDLQARVSRLAGGRPLRAQDVPPVLARAVVAVEDERFFIHHGLDTLGMGRAFWDDATRRCACEGGSTITQQLAKIVYFSDQDRFTRKVPGMAVALKLELRHGKAQIMADYWSVVGTGYGLIGARAAACVYFGHDLGHLSAAEAAQLAGSVNAPSRYDPRAHPDLTRRRRDYVLDRMVEAGYLGPAQSAAAKAEPVLAGGVAHPAC